jgi:hypothetical protein
MLASDSGQLAERFNERKHAMQKPLVHLNGTSRDSLKYCYRDASNALRTAIDALGECAPNARDYYPLGDSAYSTATNEHAARMRALVELRSDINELLEHVID